MTGSANLLTSVICRCTEALYGYVTTEVGALPAIREVGIMLVLQRVKQGQTMLRGGRLDIRS